MTADTLGAIFNRPPGNGSTTIPRVVLGGVSSGVGKTTITVGIARALASRGLRVALFKCGPDYLDPTYHARATGAPSQTLDGWMMGRDAVRSTFAKASEGADIALIEGVMGLFDGASATSEEGSSAEIAKWLEAPVVLVVDASGMARSIAALALGYRSFDPDLKLAGVIANRVGSKGHTEILSKALGALPLVGGLPRSKEHSFPERHLGLRTADEKALPDAEFEFWGMAARESLDLDLMLRIASLAPALDVSVSEVSAREAACRIGVARDEAFHFYYPDNLARLEAAGARLVPFSPIRDSELPDVDGLYLGGGYPESHAKELSANTAMRAAIASFAERGGPLYAECGGLMYLTRAIIPHDSKRFEMVGLFPFEATMCTSLRALGYVEVETRHDSILGQQGTRFRGHQFRYSELVPSGDSAAESREAVVHPYSQRTRRAREATPGGYSHRSVVASYVHAHWASNPRVPVEFVNACTKFRHGESVR